VCERAQLRRAVKKVITSPVLQLYYYYYYYYYSIKWSDE